MRATISIFVLAAALAASNSSLADPVQSSEDIIKFFAKTSDLGASRGICVGAQDQCESKTDAPAPSGLDMLINFNLNSAELLPEARAKLGEFAKALKDNRLKTHNFVVEGYTDASGAPAYNDRLSEQRAQSVTAFLLSSGIEPARVKAVGLGATNPRVPDPYDPVNRRVEMRLSVQ
ncbi:OmpA family protein [Mesorhizobium amorphae]|uniref:OmpA family protein n=1 Tax=Mesorhizobium amorphae TaxID=71433 RepID=UPI00177F9DC9|nr:OmpA family protein [Mesorhizobium amorphae]